MTETTAASIDSSRSLHACDSAACGRGGEAGSTLARGGAGSTLATSICTIDCEAA